MLEDRLALSFVLGTASLVEGPSGGTSSDIVAGSGNWTAKANASWLHTTSRGAGNGLATFTVDPDTGPTRSGTLTIAGRTLTVTQAGRGYVAVDQTGTLVSAKSSALSSPTSVAVDGAGNVYIADTGHNAIKEWHAATHRITTLVSADLDGPVGVAVDRAGNVYFTDGPDAIKEWHTATGRVTTLVSGLNVPYGVAVDGAGNVYIADSGNNAIKEWHAATHKVTTLVSAGLAGPGDLAVDRAGNVYIADSGHDAIKEWHAATHKVTTLVSADLAGPVGVAVDGAGSVYIADSGRGPTHEAIKEWDAATRKVTTLVVSLNRPTGVAVDGAGSVYIAENRSNEITEWPLAFVPGGAVGEPAAAGSDKLLPVLPTTAPLTGDFAPFSDPSWLTVDSVSKGVIHFSFTQNRGAARTAGLNVLGVSITVTQAAAIW